MAHARSLALTLVLGALALAQPAHAQPIVPLAGFETRASTVVPADDGGFYVVGVRRTPGQGGSTPMVARVGPDLSLVWARAYDKPGHFHPHVGAPRVGGGVVLAGEANPKSGDWHFWAAAVDDRGKEVWSLVVGPQGKNLVPDGKAGSFFARAILGAPDGGAWVGGDVGIGASGQALVVRVDARGKPVFATHFGDAVRHERVIDFVAQGAGVLALVRQNVDTNRINPDALELVAIDAKGAVGAHLELVPNVETYGEPLVIRGLTDGRWVVFGRGSWIALFGQDGRRQWLREYRELDGADFTGAAVTDDGLVAVGGIGKDLRLVGFDRQGVRRFERVRRHEDGTELEAGGLAVLGDGRVVVATTVKSGEGDVALPQLVDLTPAPLDASFDRPRCPADADLFERDDTTFMRRALVCMAGGAEVGERVVIAPSPTIERAIVPPEGREVRLIMRASRHVIGQSLAVPGRDYFRFGAIEADLVPVNGDKAYPNTVFHAGNGVWMELYPDGGDRLAVQLRGGFAQGPLRRHHANGALAETGEFVDGLPHGDWVRYDERGQEIGRFRLERGTGTIFEWDERGQVARIVEVKNGRLDGWDTTHMYGKTSWATCHHDGAVAFKARVDDDAGFDALKVKRPCR